MFGYWSRRKRRERDCARLAAFVELVCEEEARKYARGDPVLTAQLHDYGRQLARKLHLRLGRCIHE